jgi:hypothetical protein
MTLRVNQTDPGGEGRRPGPRPRYYFSSVEVPLSELLQDHELPAELFFCSHFGGRIEVIHRENVALAPENTSLLDPGHPTF